MSAVRQHYKLATTGKLGQETDSATASGKGVKNSDAAGGKAQSPPKGKGKGR